MPAPTRDRRLARDEREHLIEQWLAGVSQQDLADAYGVTQATISYHVRKLTGARGGERSVRFEAGPLLRTLLPKVEALSDDADQMARRLRALQKAIVGATSDTVKATSSVGGSAVQGWDEQVRKARAGTGDVRFDGEIIWFGSERWTVEEFWDAFPGGIALGEDDSVYTRDDALAARAVNQSFTPAALEEETPAQKRANKRKVAPPQVEDEPPDNTVDEQFYEYALRELGVGRIA